MGNVAFSDSSPSTPDGAAEASSDLSNAAAADPPAGASPTTDAEESAPTATPQPWTGDRLVAEVDDEGAGDDGAGDGDASGSGVDSLAIAPSAPSTASSRAAPSPYAEAKAASYGCAENGSCYGDISTATGRAKTVSVRGYYRRDGTYVRGHYRSRPR
jgi:hypothetical protein